MPIIETYAVTDDAKNLASFLDQVLDRIITTYESYNMPLPDRRYWTFGTPVVDCEQLVVSVLQMYIGPPGDQATAPSRCHDPKSATLNISVSRAVPIAEPNGRPPLPQDIERAARVSAYDAWILMEGAAGFDVWDEYGPGLGVIATVDAAPPEAGFQTIRVTITMAIP